MITPETNVLSSKRSCPAPPGDAITDDFLFKVAESILPPCPEAGDGAHKWAYRASKELQAAGFTFEQGVPIIEYLMTREPSPEKEVEQAWNSAANEKNETETTPRWPAVDRDAVERIAESGPSARELVALSPRRINLSGRPMTAEIFDTLYPDGPLLCLGERVRNKKTGKVEHRYETWERDFWHGLEHGYEYMVPNPMAAQYGTNKEGRRSKRCLDNTGPRRFIICEFDKGTIDSHAARLWHLREHANLVLVLFSASKSLHGWFPISDESEAEQFFSYAVSLGADDRLWTRCQAVRVPDGDRKLGFKKCPQLPELPPRRQAVLYFSPDNVEGSR